MTFDIIHSGDALKGGFLNRHPIIKTTDYVEFVWKKYFDKEPNEFQLRYIARQQGKTRALLQVMIMMANGLIGGSSEQVAVTTKTSNIRQYIDRIYSILEEMNEEDRIEIESVIDNGREVTVNFKNGSIRFLVMDFPRGYNTKPFETNVHIMDY